MPSDYREKQRKKLYNDVKFACDNLGYTLLSKPEDLINNQSVVKYICPEHGVQEKSATGLKQGKHCRLCANQIRSKHMNATRLITEDRINRYYTNALTKCKENGYELISQLGDIVKSEDYVLYKCPKHGEHSMKYDNLMYGKRCPDCATENARKKYAFSPDEVSKQVQKLGGTLLNQNDYINQDLMNLRILCPSCGKEFTTSLKHFKQHGGQSCKNCSSKESVGERRIRNWLDDHGIKYTQGKWFDDCRDKNPLPFDFYLEDHNKIVEFDGVQHFKETHYFKDRNGVSTTEITKSHDAIKNKYCADNNINLIRISYKQINQIEKILEKELIA